MDSGLSNVAKVMSNDPAVKRDASVNHALQYLEETIAGLEETVSHLYDRTGSIVRDDSPEVAADIGVEVSEGVSSVHRSIVANANRVRRNVNSLAALTRRIDL